ncbi:MAG: hypothetical protein ABIS01_09975, partial [Ferruginibacter sp.]
MKNLLLVLAILLLAFGAYWYFTKDKTSINEGAKTGPLVVLTHTLSFNSGIDSLLNAYFNLKDAFVIADSNVAKAAAVKLATLADSSILAELKTDPSGIYQSAAMQMGDVKL